MAGGRPRAWTGHRDQLKRRELDPVQLARGGRLVSWPGATHSAHLDHPDELLAVVREVARAAFLP